MWIDFNNDVAKAQSTAADFLTAHPDSHKVFFGVAHDPAAVGVLAAVETANRSNDCMIIAHGGEDVGIQMLKEGTNSFMGTVAYDPGKYGELLIPLAKKIMDGEDVPIENYSEQYMITRENVK
jgi:ribose transport system substrate-binding protein